MEESCRGKPRKSHDQRLLVVMSQHHKDYLPQMNRTITKMDQCFSTHVKRISKKRLPFKPVKELGENHHLIKNNNKIQENILKHQGIDSRNTRGRKCFPEKKTQLIINKPYYLQYFKPKTYEEIVDRHQTKILNEKFNPKIKQKTSFMSLHVTSDNELPGSSKNLLKPLRQSEGKALRLSKNLKREGSKLMNSTNFGSFMDIQKVPSKQFNKELSLFSRRQLECYYQSLIKFSNCNQKKYREGIQTMLNLMDVASNQKVLSKQLTRFELNPTFTQFIQIYTKIVDANLRENVMDFFDIIFQECGLKELSRQQFNALLCERMPKADAMEIADEIFYQMDYDKKVISASDIFTLCFTNDQFCMFMKKFTLIENKKK